MNDQIKGILLKQLQLLQEAGEMQMSSEDAARLSEALATAVRVAEVLKACYGHQEPLRE